MIMFDMILKIFHFPVTQNILKLKNINVTNFHSKDISYRYEHIRTIEYNVCCSPFMYISIKINNGTLIKILKRNPILFCNLCL